MGFEQGPDGRITSGGKTSTSRKPFEETDPEKYAELVAMVAEDPETTFVRLAEACGLGPKAASAIVKRLETKYLPVAEESKRITRDGLIDLIGEKIPLLLNGITVEKRDASDLRGIAVALGILVEKQQLLKGEPTQIMTFEERRNLNELGPAMVQELKRRGMAIDVTFQEVSARVSPPETVQMEAVSKTAAREAARRAKQNR